MDLTELDLLRASHPSDSLVMADMAVNMANAGCQYITVLVADFMSQNLHAILDHAGFRKSPSKLISVAAEGADLDCQLVIDMGVRVDGSMAATTDQRIVREHWEIINLDEWGTHDAES
ncbi:quinolinate synthase, chloroplastic [Cinnamomum micranthum f. kanehirae]|uniref:Quinolinate synthase, chloroplastic n=1 Tax=Cinnamomum micranthum f. kanehirae TaxID=337451 RepID=A0A3S3N706_9MAGN|nr:quinolinate synthase, chloroplastic [Cinnamomum micranthum f. kanehirae]